MNIQHIFNALEIAKGKQARQGLVDILTKYTETKKQLEQISPEIATCFQEEHESTMQQVSRAISAIDNAYDAKTLFDQTAGVITMQRELMLLDEVLDLADMQISATAAVLTGNISVVQSTPGICEIRFSYPDEEV